MSGARIMLIDDDRDLVATLRLVLERSGYAVSAVHDPREAIDRVRAERPDLLVVDVMMPNATEGFHLVWRVRQLGEPCFRRLPIIVLSAIHERTALRFDSDSPDGTYQPGEFLPVQEFLDKPIDPRVLVDRIAEVLSRTARPAEG